MEISEMWPGEIKGLRLTCPKGISYVYLLLVIATYLWIARYV